MAQYREHSNIGKSMEPTNDSRPIDNQADDDSLPDITLYTFDSISDVVGATEVNKNTMI